MLDARILAAVLASLTAVAAGMNGGSINTSPDFNPSTNGLDFQELNSDPVNSLKQLFISKPEPTNSVKAHLKVEDIGNEKLKLQEATVRSSNLTSIKLGTNSMSSDSGIVFHGFKGTLKPGESSEIAGSAKRVSSSGVDISGKVNVKEKVNSSRFVINEKGVAGIKFSNVEGHITSGSASTEFRNGTRKLKINSFSGKITIRPENNSVVLDGKVDRLTAGDFSFGG